MTDSQERIRQAQDLYRRGDQDGARAALAALLRDDPNNAEAWFNAAQMATSSAQSIKLLQRALHVDPFHEEADLMLARLQTSAIVDDPAPAPPTPQSAPVRQSPTPKQMSKEGQIGMIAAIIVVGLLLVVLLVALASNLGVGGTSPAVIPTLAGLPTETSVPVVLPTQPPVLPTETPAPTLTPTLAVYDVTATAFREIARTQQSDLALTGTAAAQTFVPPG
ncbi:MAG: tetratricopeptide repeat protein [Anaerolineae bacterium]|nr:tetratricopeptide repeat protein [Anaerolineae bacterium]